MSLWKIAWRSLRQRGLSSTLTGVSMALGVALVVAVLVISGVVNESFTRNAQGYDLIVGAKGGKLQLVLNTVYHLSTPIENIPYHYYKEFTEGKFASSVGVAIPYCLGDNYEGYRVVGTLPAMFDEFEYMQGRKYEFAEGGNFRAEAFFEAVIGSLVARKTGLKVGDRFRPTHGVVGDEGHKHDAFTVVGILEPTGTPNDRALFVNMEGFYLLDGHAKEPPAPAANAHTHSDEAPAQDSHHDEHADQYAAQGDSHSAEKGAHDDAAHHQASDAHEPIEHEEEHADHEHTGHADHVHEHVKPLPEEQKEVTAILVRTASPLAMMSLPRQINKDSIAQAVAPQREIANLFESIVGNIQWLLFALAVLIVVVAGIGIMVGIYNSMSERRREIAVMRALGAGRSTVMTVVLLESILLSLAGGVAGVLLGHGLIATLGPLIVAQTGVSIGFLQFEMNELALIPGLVVLATLAGFLPSLAAYRTDVAKALSASP